MATKRIKDISTTATTFAADDFIALDASSVGTRKMAKASLITQVGANYLEKADNLSDVASKDTAKLNLEVPDVGTAVNEVPLNGMLNSGAYLDFDAFYETGTWTPTLSYSGGSTGIAYGANTFGYYTKIGNTVSYSGYLTLTDKGSDGGFVYLHVPFAAASATDSHQSGLTFGITSGMASLTSPISGVYLQNDSKILLYDSGATGTNALTEANFTNSSELRFSGTYQIA